MTKESKFDVMWMKKFNCICKTILKQINRFPSSQTIYQEHKIGYWITESNLVQKKRGRFKQKSGNVC